MVENTTLTKQSTQGPTEVVEGYWKGDLKEAHDEYVKEFKAAGYKVLFEELEDHDSEVSWKGEGRTGQVALRDDCGGGKIYVHITNRPGRTTAVPQATPWSAYRAAAGRDSPVEGSRLAAFLPISPPTNGGAARHSFQEVPLP